MVDHSAPRTARRATRAGVAALAAASLALTACSGGEDGGANADGGVVSANGTEPQNPLIPANTNEVGGGRIVEMIFAGLVYYDAEGETQLEVAESIETEDQKNYTITLKEGETFADGTPVTANSFVDAWNYAVENALVGAYNFESIAGYEEGGDEMEGLKVVDDRTFTVELEEPEVDFQDRLGQTAFYPLPESAFEDIEAFGEKPVGNGPYQLVEWTHNQGASLEPNPEYDGDREAKNDGVEYVFYAQVDAAYNDLLAGNLDVIDTIPESSQAAFEDDLEGRSVNQPAAIFQSLTIPHYLEHFDGEEGKLRRQAISLAIDRDDITETIFGGTRSPAREFTSPVIPGFEENLPGSEVLEFDPERARELWEEADEISKFDGELTIGYNADGDHQAWVDAVANQLRNNLDIDAHGDPYPDFKSFQDDLDSDSMTGAFRTGWQGDYPLSSNFLEPLYTATGSSNYSKYDNEEFDKLIGEAKRAETPEEGEEIFNRAQEILLKDLPVIPLWYSNTTGGWADTVEDVQFGWNSVPRLFDVVKR